VSVARRHRLHGAQWRVDSPVRERVIDLRHFDRRKVHRAEQQRRYLRRLALEPEVGEFPGDGVEPDFEAELHGGKIS